MHTIKSAKFFFSKEVSGIVSCDLKLLTLDKVEVYAQNAVNSWAESINDSSSDTSVCLGW